MHSDRLGRSVHHWERVSEIQCILGSLTLPSVLLLIDVPRSGGRSFVFVTMPSG